MHLTIIEKNKSLIEIQKKNLKFKNISWNKNFNISNKKIPTIIFSNEFFDCFPVRQFYKNKIWYEKLIKYNDSIKNLTFVSHKVADKNILKTLEKFDAVKVAEISESRNRYFKLICKFIRPDSSDAPSKLARKTALSGNKKRQKNTCSILKNVYYQRILLITHCLS